MADALVSIVERARAALSSWVESLPGGRALTARELHPYALHLPLCGWRVTVEGDEGLRAFNIVACAGFPWEPVRIAPAGAPLFLRFPHVEKDGLLCLTNRQTTIDHAEPVAVAQALLTEAAVLVTALESGAHTQDFRDEFLSYWGWAATHKRHHVVNLCRAGGQSRRVWVWHGKAFFLVADSEDDIRVWLDHRGRKISDGPLRTEETLLEVVPVAPLPREYPETGKDLSTLLARFDPGAIERLENLLTAADEPPPILLAVGTANGVALAAVRLLPLDRGRGRNGDPLKRGFRPGRLPKEVRLTRLAGARVGRLTVERADAAWIHGRGADPRFERLRAAHVVLVGAGSLGAPTARLLGQAGIGKLTIIDPKALGYAQVGRHELGVGDVGQPKAVALARKLRSDFPHIRSVEPLVMTVEQALAQHGPVLAQADLIVATTGSWAPNGLLADWRDALADPPPAVFGWTEPHAAAGHAILLPDREGDFRAGFNATGVPSFVVTEWPADLALKQEPACGAVYQPYGPIELSFVAALVADTAVQHLVSPGMGAIHRIWAAPIAHILSAGGRYSGPWTAEYGTAGGQLVERAWPHLRRLAGSADAEAA